MLCLYHQGLARRPVGLLTICSVTDLESYLALREKVVRMLFQTSCAVSHGAGFSVILIRVLQVSKNRYTGQLLSILHVTLWAAIIKGISGISQDSQAFDMASIVSMMLASVMLVAYVASVIAQRKEDDEIEEEYSNSLKKLLNQRAHVLLAVWISSILANMPPFVARQPRHVLIFCTGYSAYSITVACACYYYRHMINHYQACPVIQHWVQYSIIHRCVANGTHLRALQAMGESRDSIARSCCRVRESLRAKAPFGRESAPDVEVIALEPIQLPLHDPRSLSSAELTRISVKVSGSSSAASSVAAF